MTQAIWQAFTMIGMLVLVGSAFPQVSKELKRASAEPDPVKRYRLALDYGEKAASACSKACGANDYEQCLELLQETHQSVELAKKSLDDTGIDASRNSRHHRNAEIRVRKILKVLESARSSMHPDDVKEYEAAVRRISDINDALLNAVMSRRKR